MLAGAAALFVAAFAAMSAARPLPGAPHCPVFPRSSQWNQRVDRLPVLAGSDRMVQSIGAGAHAHADFGSGLYNGEAAVVESLPGGVIPSALVRTEAGRTRRVRTIDLERIAAEA